jgi:tripartite-type tricarboxylate transporter receptor subunit TctC
MNRSLLLSAGIGLTIALPAWTQTFPAKPIRIVVAYAAGGPNDLMARSIAPTLSARLGQNVIVDNRPGAGSNIGSAYVAKSARDGHTLLLGSPANAINPALYASMPYDPLKELAPVTLLAVNPYLLVAHPSLPVRSVRELIALAKSRPGEVTFASSGAGGASHLTGELLKVTAKIDILHVPYKGGGPALVDLAGGRVSIMFDNMITAVPYVKSGRLRALGVTSLTRSEVVPDVPTVHESALPKFESLGWFGIFAPAGTPPETVTSLNQALVAIVREAQFVERLRTQGATVVGSSPAEFDRFFRADAAKWAPVVQASGARAD